MPSHLIPPYGGTLCDLVASEARRAELHAASREWPSWDLSPEQLCELELLASGAYSPLRGFMTRADAEAVDAAMRLADGTFWPVPVVLAVPGAVASRLAAGGTLALRDAEGVMLAALAVAEVWQPDAAVDAWRVGGAVEALQLPVHHDFTALRLSPAEMRHELARQGWRRVVAYQTSRAIHRAEHAATLAAAKASEASLLVHIEAGKGSSADVDHFTRVRCCQAAISRYPKDTAKLALLPYAPRLRGQRDLLLRALIARNFGCTHLLVDASEGSVLENGVPAPAIAELGIVVATAEPMVYLEEQGGFVAASKVPAGARPLHLREHELRERLAGGRDIPAWFSFPDVIEELQRAHPPRDRQGFTVFFTGLSGAGKSTIASILLTKLLEMGGRPVTLLDGDIVRKNLSSELGFSKEHRDINIRRIGFVASEITKNGGIAICAPIAPYDVVRKENRALIERVGGFILAFVSTPLSVCEQRDRKGLYAKARAGIIPQFTGVSDPYEEPADAEIVLDTTQLAPEEAAQELLLHLEKAGFIGAR
jgi:sulfate adenylyltransferase